MDKILLLVDFDGLVCKSMYGAIRNSDEDTSLNDLIMVAYESLMDRLKDIEDKVQQYFDDRPIESILCMSGHTWKKDLYSSYKATRKKDARIGAFRDFVLFTMRESIIKIDGFEADDVITVLNQAAKNSSKATLAVIASDDKDLKYIGGFYTGLDKNSDILYKEDNHELYCQLLAGDSEDNIVGISRVGMKTADKLLAGCYMLRRVVNIYKDKEISEEDCIKNIELVMPLAALSRLDIETADRMLNTSCSTYKCLLEAGMKELLATQSKKIRRIINSVYSK